MNILAVDDHDGSASMLQLYLQLKKHTCDIALTAMDAELLLSNKGYDALVLDYLLTAEQTGLDLLRWCRAHNILTPAVIVTAVDQSQLDQIQSCIVAEQLKPALLMQKPAEAPTLLSTLEMLVKGD